MAGLWAAVMILASDAAPVRTIQLVDPAIGAELRGAVLQIERKNGSYYQGTVTYADAEKLVIDCHQEVPAGEVKSIVTLQPAKPPVHTGAAVELLPRKESEGAAPRGMVLDAAGEVLLLHAESSVIEAKWSSLRAITVLREAPTVGEWLGGATTATAASTPLAAAPTPAPTPAPRPAESAATTPPGAPSAAASAPVPASAPAPADDRPRDRFFGDRRTIEVGGTFSLFHGSAGVETEVDRETASGYAFVARPFFGWFLYDGLEVLLEVSVSSSATNFNERGDEWSTRSGVRVGAGYLFRLSSGTRVGGQFLYGPYTHDEEFEDTSGITFEYGERGTVGSVGLALRVPLGESALFTFGAGYYQERYTFEIYPGFVGSDGDGWREGFETTVGLSVWADPF